MRLQTVISAATLVGALLLVAGCDGGTPSVDATATRAAPTMSVTPKPAPISTPTVNAPGTPSPIDFDASKPPRRPAALDGPASEETVAEVARYFISLFPYVFSTGDLANWEALSGSDCEWCADIADIVKSDFDAGKRREGGRMDFVDVQAFHDRGQDYVAVVRLREQPSRVLASDGSVVSTTDHVQDAKLELGLRWTGDAWSVLRVGVDLLGTPCPARQSGWGPESFSSAWFSLRRPRGRTMKPPGSVSVARALPTGWAPASLIGNTVKASVLGLSSASTTSCERRSASGREHHMPRVRRSTHPCGLSHCHARKVRPWHL